MKWIGLSFCALALAGCTGSAAEVPTSWLAVIEAEAATPPPPPAECSPKGDPKWIDLPERDVLRDEAARNARANKDRFREIEGRRRICAVGLVPPSDTKGDTHAKR